MQIKSQFTDTTGKLAEVIYQDADSFKHLVGQKVTQAYGFCFYQEKFLIVHNKKKDFWTPAGGSIEKGETFEECLKREVQEESNMKVLSFAPIGYQEVHFGGKIFNQLRYFCIVEPHGEFTTNTDPCGDVDRIELIDPADYKQYFDWGEVGDRIMQRALEIKNGFK